MRERGNKEKVQNELNWENKKTTTTKKEKKEPRCRHCRRRRPFVLCMVRGAGCRVRRRRRRGAGAGAAVLCCVLCCAFVATVCCAGRCAFAIEYQIGLCRVSPTPTAQKKKNCYFAFLAIPPWLWRPPYATRNATAIQWHFFKFSSRYSAMAAI